MTPQIARIDAHLLKSDLPSRLCYAGPVLRARPKQAFENRELFQLGAELYGSTTALADVEVIELMLNCLKGLEISAIHMDMGHVGVFRALTSEAKLDGLVEARLFDALQRKSIPDLADLVASLELSSKTAEAFVGLPQMRGSLSQLNDAMARLRGFGTDMSVALENLCEVMTAVDRRSNNVQVDFDLSELRGYHYHTGVVFSAFCEGFGREIARGGRYDSIGAAYGRSRPATGFSLDLRQLLKLQQARNNKKLCILAPSINDDSKLEDKIASLRNEGQRVVRRLDDSEQNINPNCDRQLVESGEGWIVKHL
jgi:ATP phosphoribosyltransferase regulatory subunit